MCVCWRLKVSGEMRRFANFSSRGWQQGHDSATNEDTLLSLVMHDLTNRLYLHLVT